MAESTTQLGSGQLPNAFRKQRRFDGPKIFVASLNKCDVYINGQVLILINCPGGDTPGLVPCDFITGDAARGSRRQIEAGLGRVSICQHYQIALRPQSASLNYTRDTACGRKSFPGDENTKTGSKRHLKACEKVSVAQAEKTPSANRAAVSKFPNSISSLSLPKHVVFDCAYKAPAIPTVV
jgi:hypothetical protein